MSSSTCIIRDLKPEDCEQLVRLIKEITGILQEPQPPTLTADILRRDGFGSAQKFGCFVLEDQTIAAEKNLVGYALFCEKYSSLVGSHIYLEDIYVDSSHRKMGYGDQLLKLVAKEAMKTEACLVDWLCLKWNTRAIEFYKAHGAQYTEGSHGKHSMQLSGEHLKKLISEH